MLRTWTGLVTGMRRLRAWRGDLRFRVDGHRMLLVLLRWFLRSRLLLGGRLRRRWMVFMILRQSAGGMTYEGDSEKERRNTGHNDTP